MEVLCLRAVGSQHSFFQLGFSRWRAESIFHLVKTSWWIFCHLRGSINHYSIETYSPRSAQTDPRVSFLERDFLLLHFCWCYRWLDMKVQNWMGNFTTNSFVGIKGLCKVHWNILSEVTVNAVFSKSIFHNIPYFKSFRQMNLLSNHKSSTGLSNLKCQFS